MRIPDAARTALRNALHDALCPFNSEWAAEANARAAAKAASLAGIKEKRLMDALMLGLGFLVRWTFFAGITFALVVYCSEADWSAFSTRFSDLTIMKVLSGFARLAIVTLIGFGLLRWAFSARPKRYLSWARLAIWACGIGIIAYRLMLIIGRR